MGYLQTVDAQLAPVVRHLERESPGDVIGIYLFGSAATSGLRPDSDIDLLVVTSRSMSTAERRELAGLLLTVSGWKGHADRFPDAAGRRPVELTSVVSSDAHSWTRAPRRDFQYGEWLREELMGGHLLVAEEDPDVVVLAATAHRAHTVLMGPALDTLIPPVAPELLRDAAYESIPEVLAGMSGDERNALLTLARILVTLDTGRIVSKDAAAEVVASSLTGADRFLMERARDQYLGVDVGAPEPPNDAMVALAGRLASRARRIGR